MGIGAGDEHSKINFPIYSEREVQPYVNSGYGRGSEAEAEA